MATIIPLPQGSPSIGKNCWLAPSATIIGDVVIADRATLWFHTVVRGDVNSIRIGEDTNIQDGVIIHCTYQKTRTIIGNKVSVGHRAVLHGCTLEDNILVGMGAIVMDNAYVESEVIIAAGAVVLEKKRLKSGYIYAGVPAKQIAPLQDRHKEIFARTAKNYPMYAKWYG